jgi:hypothetical protein
MTPSQGNQSRLPAKAMLGMAMLGMARLGNARHLDKTRHLRMARQGP